MLGLTAKMSSRFLLALNILDEFGFRPGTSSVNDYFRGDPAASHPILFDDVIRALGGNPEGDYSPTEIARTIRSYYESCYHDYIALLTLVGVTEEEAMVYSPAMRAASRHAGVDVDTGYYIVHGTTDDMDLNAADDYHQQDIWEILATSMIDSDHATVERVAFEVADLWDQFWSLHLDRSTRLGAADGG